MKELHTLKEFYHEMMNAERDCTVRRFTMYDALTGERMVQLTRS